jgi:hypothetical protein
MEEVQALPPEPHPGAVDLSSTVQVPAPDWQSLPEVQAQAPASEWTEPAVPVVSEWSPPPAPAQEWEEASVEVDLDSSGVHDRSVIERATAAPPPEPIEVMEADVELTETEVEVVEPEPEPEPIAPPAPVIPVMTSAMPRLASAPLPPAARPNASVTERAAANLVSAAPPALFDEEPTFEPPQGGLEMPAGAVAAPSFIEGEHRVIVHTMEGQVKRGTVRDLDLLDDAISLEQQSGAAERIPTGRVKAIFFMLAAGARQPSVNGKKIRVTFKDGRQVAGFSEDFRNKDAGFFVIPADNRTNTARIYIFRSSVQAVAEG